MHLKFYLRSVFFIFLSVSSLQANYSDYLKEYFQNSKETWLTEELKGGLSGAKNYKVTVDDTDYVLRILNPAEPLENRKQEIAAATYAGERKIGPPVFYFDANHSAMIMSFVNGRTLNNALLKDKNRLLACLQTMKRLHQSTGDFPKGLTVFERIRFQLKNLKQGLIPAPIEKINKALKKLDQIEKMFQDHPLVPCHNDLSALNIIVDGTEFKFIDWTDSGMGYIYNDLGYFVLVNHIEEDRFCEVLELYLGRLPTQQELLLLKLMKKVNTLRIFASNFPAYEPSIPDPEQRFIRSRELVELINHDLLPLSYYFDLHTKGHLFGQKLIVEFSLSSLQSFLKME